MSGSWLWMTAAGLGREIEAGRIDARALTELFLDEIASQEDAPLIYARTTPARARAEAAAAASRARAGLRRGPLDGVPVSWKDLFDTAGVATEAGSALLRDRLPVADAAVLATAGRAGLVCLGKTHMTELAFSGLGVNPVTATPPNVNDPDLAPGGSSSGAAASVAFGLAAAGLGTDTGGSARVPAAWNDLVGLKTTHGLLPMQGIVPLCPHFDTVGPLCRSVEDAALVLAALGAGPAPDLAGAQLRGRRLFVYDTTPLGDTRAAPAAAFESALERLAAAGAEIGRGDLPGIAPALPLTACLVNGEAFAVWGATIEAHPDLMFAPVRDRYLAGAAFSTAEYLGAWRQLDDLRAQYHAATAAWDAVLLPTTPNLAPDRDRLLADPAYFTTENLLTLRNARIANLLGLCALTLPTGHSGCGLMAMAAPHAEARLLRLGAAMERALA